MKIDPATLTMIGVDLKRPECVLCLRSGDVFACHMGSGIVRIRPDGRQETIGSFEQVDGDPWIPNGIAILPDRTFLIANMGPGGGVWRLDLDGNLSPFLREADGEVLAGTNFVYTDNQNRTWVTVTTRQKTLQNAFRPGVADGYVVLIEGGKARIVADGIAFANELRVDAHGSFLYLVETMKRQITRFAIQPNGDLGEPEVFATFGHGTFPDGFAFDAEGCLWVTSVVTNRLIRVSPDGSPTIVLEDSDPAHTDKIEEDIAAGALVREDIQRQAGKVLKNISSIAFGGPDCRTVYLGSLGGGEIPSFRSPVPGAMPVHWEYTL